ncbi:MAG TPA: hypothetical protein VGL01_25560 [Trinickia sp.]|uniref:hypothetical protein n=1 Tax=Trinickia sp. TaxID=2571163 RepID=UPI002F402E3B
MRWRNASLALLAAAAACISGTAHAARWNVGVFVGAPAPYYPVVPAPYYYGPYPPPYVPYAPYPPAYYGPPVIVSPPVVVQPPEPDVYIERSQAAPSATQPSSSGKTYWYCAASKRYYPYVKDCAGGWQDVPATPERNR